MLAMITAVTVLGACGETIDLATTTTTALRDESTDDPADDPTDHQMPLEALLAEASDPAGSVTMGALIDAMVANFQGLDDDAAVGDRQRLDQILAIWEVLEPRLIEERPGLHHGFTQAVELAAVAVERRRPADATKSQRIALEMRASASE
jgi:hypothetical protein